MRKTLLLTLILLALSAWVAAQQDTNSQNPNASQGSTQSSANQNSVQGCLGGSGHNFTVTDNSGTSYQLQLPPGADTSNLKPHIGEEVRVEGTMNGGGGANSSAGGASGRSINVKNIYRISSTCNAKTPGTRSKPQ